MASEAAPHPAADRPPSPWRPVWRHALTYRAGWAGILAVTLLMIGGSLLAPWPLALIIDGVLAPPEAGRPAALEWLGERLLGGHDPRWLVACLVVAQMALHLLNTLLGAISAWLWVRVGQGASYSLALEVVEALQRRAVTYHGRTTAGDSMTRALGDTHVVQWAVAAVLIKPLAAVSTLVAVTLVLWRMDPTLTLVALAAAPAMAYGAVILGKPARRLGKKASELSGRLSAHVQQSISGLGVVQAFGREQDETRRFTALAETVIDNQHRSTFVKQASELLGGLLPTLGVAAVLWMGARQVMAGELLLGGLLVFLGYAATLKDKLKDLLDTYIQLQTLRGQAERVAEVLHATPEVVDRPDAFPLPNPSGHIRLECVTFGYLPDQPVLREVSLDVQPGQTLGLVGSTGSGKSTLAALVLRLVDPQHGRVLLNGSDVRDLRLADVRRASAWVSQEPFLLPASVLDNVRLGLPGASRDDVRRALEAAGAWPFVSRLPEGMDTVLAERGGTLSGGERQRLAIARALLRDAPILVLDEPTSALDANTERDVMEAMRGLRVGRTSIVIAHRLSTVRHADAIAVLEQGRVVELGTHSALLALGGTYAAMWNAQNGPRKPVAA